MKERRTFLVMALVLVVDDEKVLLKIMERLLLAKSYEVLTASSASEALKLANRHKPTILVTDYNLGDRLNGLDICRAFAQNSELAETRRIIISGQVSQLPGRGTVFDLLLPKPFTSVEFFKALETVQPLPPAIGEWLTR